MTSTEQIEMAQAAVALVRALVDDPEDGLGLYDGLLADTCVEAVAHLAACLVRDLPDADEYLGNVGLHLARSLSSTERSTHVKEEPQGPQAAQAAPSRGLAAYDARSDGQGDQGVRFSEASDDPAKAGPVAGEVMPKKVKRSRASVAPRPVVVPVSTPKRRPTTVLRELARPVIAAKHVALRKWDMEQRAELEYQFLISNCDAEAAANPNRESPTDYLIRVWERERAEKANRKRES